MKKALNRTIAFILTILAVLPLCGCQARRGEAEKETLRIGITAGTIFDKIALQEYPDAEICYFNAVSDLPVALKNHKIDLYVDDEPTAIRYSEEYTNQYISRTLADDNYGIIFSKDNAALRDQFNEFLREFSDNGGLDRLRAIYIDKTEADTSVDFASLTGESGTLSFSVAGTTEPFDYVRDGQYEGYEIALAAAFCREYGYALAIENTNFSGVLSAVTSGRIDMGSACISITEERKKSLLFSDPIYVGRIVQVENRNTTEDFGLTVNDLAGSKVGVIAGTLFDELAREKITDCAVLYYNSYDELSQALSDGEIDAYINDGPVARYLTSRISDHHILTYLNDDSYGIMMPKTSESEKLREQINEFLKNARENGVMDEIEAVWFGSDEKAKVIDTDSLSAENGVLSLAVYSQEGAPICYEKDGFLVGYDLDIVAHFCKEYGYGLEITDYSLSDLFYAVTTGKCDLAASSLIITEERAERMLISDPLYYGGSALVVASSPDELNPEGLGFFERIERSFIRTFIDEDRWQLFLGGIGVTLFITLLSILLGTVFGFLIYFFVYRSMNAATRVFDALGNIIEKNPIVVILMILYYIVFGKAGVSGVAVAIISMTLLFSNAVLRLIKTGADTVGKGQYEAALALGYSENRAFLRVIFPQSLRYILPGYKSAIVTLIKDTAIVGYIAVQDLTRVSDIIRSRTYEAFFPLIATAVIYYLMARCLEALINLIDFSSDPRRKEKDSILKGVKTK